MPPTDERVPGESDDEELPPAAGPSAPGPSFLDATDTTVIRIDDSPLVLPPSVDPDDDGPEPVIDERVPGESDDEVDDPRARRRRRAKRRARNHRRIIINMLACKYEVVAQAARSFGWRRASDDSEEFNILWADSYISFDTLSSLNKYQKANHFPGMSELAKKNLLAKNLNRLAKALPADFGFFPPSFNLPADLDALRAWVSPLKRKPTLIVKPDAGCQGKGIFLTKSLDDLAQVEGCVAQQYLPSPLLVDGYKFDMRLYVVVVSCSPLRVLLFKEGLARFCTEPYRAPTESNLGDTFMHLTNFAINKHHSEFEIDESGEGGSKRSLSSLMSYLRAAGYPADRIWLNIKAVIVKTLLAVQPQLRNTYHQILGDDNTGFSCFEILGFDILLDRKARPWLLEVNHAPSFACGSALDELIKRELMRSTMRLLNPSPYHKKKYREELKREAMERAMQSRHTKGPKLSYEEKEQLRAKQKQNAQENWAKHEERVLGNFERIYPPPEEETPAKALQMYERVLAAATAIYSSGPGRRAPTRAAAAAAAAPAAAAKEAAAKEAAAKKKREAAKREEAAKAAAASEAPAPATAATTTAVGADGGMAGPPLDGLLLPPTAPPHVAAAAAAAPAGSVAATSTTLHAIPSSLYRTAECASAATVSTTTAPTDAPDRALGLTPTPVVMTTIPCAQHSPTTDAHRSGGADAPSHAVPLMWPAASTPASAAVAATGEGATTAAADDAAAAAAEAAAAAPRGLVGIAQCASAARAEGSGRCSPLGRMSARALTAPPIAPPPGRPGCWWGSAADATVADDSRGGLSAPSSIGGATLPPEAVSACPWAGGASPPLDAAGGSAGFAGGFAAATDAAAATSADASATASKGGGCASCGGGGGSCASLRQRLRDDAPRAPAAASASAHHGGGGGGTWQMERPIPLKAADRARGWEGAASGGVARGGAKKTGSALHAQLTAGALVGNCGVCGASAAGGGFRGGPSSSYAKSCAGCGNAHGGGGWGSAGSDPFAARNGRAPPSAGALEAANGGSWRPDRAVTAPTTVAAVAGGGAPTTLPPTFGGWSAARRLSGDAPPQGVGARAAARARDTVAAVQLTALNFNPPTSTRTTPAVGGRVGRQYFNK